MEIKIFCSLVMILVLLPVCLTSGLYRKCGVKSTTATTLMLLLFMLSFLTCALTRTTEDAVGFIECGDIEPIDPYAFIGERLVLTCAIRDVDNTKNASLYFDTPKLENGNWSNVEINQTGYEIIQLNSTAIQLISPVLTVEDAESHNVSRAYRCMVREVVNNCTKRSKKYVNNQHVKIDYFPHNPENFKCQVYNWDKLTCTWDMVPYFHKDDIDVECFWKSDLQFDESKTWSIEFSEETFTSFTIDSFNMMPTYWFYFNITNIARSIVNTSAIFDIFPFEIVKPAPVDFISFHGLSDTCVTVVYNHSRQFRDKVFTVRYTSKCSTEQQITIRDIKVTVCDLNPYTNYTFFVDSRPLDLHSKGNGSMDTVGFTSDPRDSSVITKPAVPAANPNLLSYTDVPCLERQCRNVLVYWKPLSPCDLHDSLLEQQYEIITNQRGSEKTWKATAYSEDLSYSLLLPDEGQVYDVKLRVITRTGKKREDFSHLVIWPRKQSPIAPSMVVEYETMKNGTNFYITLDLTEAQSQTSQILYWCHGNRGSGCQEPMSFMEINGSSEEIFIENYIMDFNLKFGVESQQLLLGEITRSGIQMVSCIYRKDQKPIIPPNNFHIAKGISETEGELSLQWDPYDCNSPDLESGYVQSYTLYYCQVIDEASCILNYTELDSSIISIERHIHNYTIRKLKPGGRYKVWLTARTSAGEGPPTDVIDTYIYIQEFPLWGQIMIGVGSLIISLVTVICFVKFHQYIKGRREAFSMIEVPATRIPFLIADDYVEIPIHNGYVHQENGHVIVGDQSAETIPDMDESEELNETKLLIPNGYAKVSMAKISSSTNLLLASGQGDQMQRLLDMSSIGNDHKDFGSYISSNDINSASSDIESDIDTKDEKKIKPAAFVVSAEPGHQNAVMLPEDYCRAVVNGDYVPNGKTNPVIYEDRLDKKFFKLQHQAVHSQSIDSLLNDGTELQELNCKGIICERDKCVDPVSDKDLLNLPQENINIEKQIESGWMKSRDDSESDELALSGDDFVDAASDDSFSLLDEICRSLVKKEKTNGYVPADEVHDDAGEPLLCNTYSRLAAYNHLDEVSLGSNDDHVRSETGSVRFDINHVRSEMDSVRSEMDSVRSENDHVRSDTDQIIHVDFVTCDNNDHVRHDDYTVRTNDTSDNNDDVRYDDYTVKTNDTSVRSVDEHGRSGDNFEKSCVDFLRKCVVPGTVYGDNPKVEGPDHTVIKHPLNIVQSGIPDNQEKEEMDIFLRQNENNGQQIIKCPSRKNYAMPVVPNGVRNGSVKIPLDMKLVTKVGKNGTSRNGYIYLPTACTHVTEETGEEDDTKVSSYTKIIGFNK